MNLVNPLGSPASQGSQEIISMSSDHNDGVSSSLGLEETSISNKERSIPYTSRKRKRSQSSPHNALACNRTDFVHQDSNSDIAKQILLASGQLIVADTESSSFELPDIPLHVSKTSCVESGALRFDAGSVLPSTDDGEHSCTNSGSSVGLASHGPEVGCDDDNYHLELWDPYDETLEISSLRRIPQNVSLRDSAPQASRLLQDAEYLVQRTRTSAENLPVKPWLPKNLRRLLPYKFGKGRVLHAGQAIHVDFTYEERFRLKAIYDDNRSANILPAQMATWLSLQFPGRQPEDVAAFIRENNLSTENGRFVFSEKLRNFRFHDASCAIVTSAVEQRSRAVEALQHDLLARTLRPQSVVTRKLSNYYPILLKPYKTFLGTSGDVNAIDFSPDGGHVVIGCAATDDEYNRSGNLSLIHTGIRTRMAPSSLVLDGKNLNRNKFSTISAAKFVMDGRFLVVGGADETLKLYSAKGRFLHDMSRKSRLCTHDIATSTLFTDCAASCHDSGDLDLHHFSTDGRVDTQAIEKHVSLAPAVVVFNDIHRRLIAGYESQQNQPCSGQATIYDLETRIKLETIGGSESYAHMAISDTGHWVAGTNSLVSGTVTVHDPRERISRHSHKFFTNQRDINEVSMLNDYVTSSATDGTCHVWDVRAGSTPLHILKHGLPKQVSGTDDICGITGSAFFSPTSFITGSSDGCVKLWNLGLAQPFLRNMIEVDSPVTRLALSAQKDQLVIGENRGAVQLWSIHGDGIATPMAENRSLVQES